MSKVRLQRALCGLLRSLNFISNRKSFKYGDMIKSMFQEYYLQDVMKLSGRLYSKYYDGLIEGNRK